MGKRDIFTKTLASIGTVLVCFPILMPVLISAILLIGERIFRLDYLMPAELGLFVLAGSLLLIWASVRARLRRGIIAWGIGIAIGMLVGGQALASATGLASGEIEPQGIWWLLVLTSLVLYDLAVILIGVGGVLLIRDLFKASGLTVYTP